jgi:hypothetical protein
VTDHARLRAMTLACVLALGACSSDRAATDADADAPEVSLSDGSLRGETITIEGVEYVCIIWDKPESGAGFGLWCDERGPS